MTNNDLRNYVIESGSLIKHIQDKSKKALRTIATKTGILKKDLSKGTKEYLKSKGVPNSHISKMSDRIGKIGDASDIIKASKKINLADKKKILKKGGYEVDKVSKQGVARALGVVGVGAAGTKVVSDQIKLDSAKRKVESLYEDDFDGSGSKLVYISREIRNKAVTGLAESVFAHFVERIFKGNVKSFPALVKSIFVGAAALTVLMFVAEIFIQIFSKNAKIKKTAEWLKLAIRRKDPEEIAKYSEILSNQIQSLPASERQDKLKQVRDFLKPDSKTKEQVKSSVSNIVKKSLN